MSNNWDGKGLPKVGDKILIKNVERSARAFAFNDLEVVVDSVYRSDKRDCLAISNEDIGVGAILFDKEWVKPIKSDRDKAVEDIMKLFKYREHDFAFKEDMGLLYDAGYKKQSGE